MASDRIITVESKSEEAFLRKKTTPFALSEKGLWQHEKHTFTRSEIGALLSGMKKIMIKANGVGLSANQIGLPYKLFVAEVPNSQGETKFYAVFNPELERLEGEKETAEEGCLSVPGVYGSVTRALRVTLKGFDRNGRPLKIKAWGLLARVFQHETDHLNGGLFLDKAKHLERVPTSDRLKTREEKMKK